VAALRPHADVRVLAGGTDAWVAAGGALEEGLERRLSEPDDLWKKPYEQVKAGEERQAMEDYLTWELALVEQIARDGTADFHVR
jgi:3-mercaptopyruvate sulfurtransferase SseA